MQYKKDTLKAYPSALEEMFKAMGADLFKAEGRLVDAHTVSAGDKKITGEYIVIGTGERAKRVRTYPARNIFTTARIC